MKTLLVLKLISSLVAVKTVFDLQALETVSVFTTVDDLWHVYI